MEVDRTWTPHLCSSTHLVPSWCVSLPWSIGPSCCFLCWSPWRSPSLWQGWDRWHGLWLWTCFALVLRIYLVLRVYALTSCCVTSCRCSCSRTPKALPVSPHQERTRQVDEPRRGVLPTYTDLWLFTVCHSVLVDSYSDESSSGCWNVNKNNEYKGCILMNFSTYYNLCLYMVFHKKGPLFVFFHN